MTIDIRPKIYPLTEAEKRRLPVVLDEYWNHTDMSEPVEALIINLREDDSLFVAFRSVAIDIKKTQRGSSADLIAQIVRHYTFAEDGIDKRYKISNYSVKPLAMLLVMLEPFKWKHFFRFSDYSEGPATG